MKFLKKSSLQTLKHVAGKLLFISQVVLISVSLPVLYYAGVTHSDTKKTEETFIRTNKGKVVIKKSEAIVIHRSQLNVAKV